jgi:uncharacterized DUF497 family protein
MRIVWDQNKSRRNFQKHGVRFEFAKRVFDDPLHISQPDPCESEARWRTLGLVNGVVVLIVAHTVKEGQDEGEEEEIRIISARKAKRLERQFYDESH